MEPNLEIKDVSLENIDHLISLCIPQDRRDEPAFIEGVKLKKRWAAKAMRKHGCIAKLAYLNGEPAGLIQYKLVPEERVIEIECIFVPEGAHSRKGIGRSLFKALMKEAEKPSSVFGNRRASALVTWAFEVPGRFPQHEFYKKMGFMRVRADNPFLLYYPLEKEYVYMPKEQKYIPQEEDRGKTLVFYEPSCPFSIYFAKKIKESIEEIAPNIQIKMIDKFEEQEEVEKRGHVPACLVNGKPIETFFLDKEKFQSEVMKALES